MSREFLTEKAFTPDSELLDALKRWNIPQVEDVNRAELETITNAIGKTREWVYEEPEPEEEEALPPTAEEIAEIRKAAFDEGFEEGKAAGFEQGQREGIEQGQKEGYEQGRESGHALGLQQGQSEIEEKSQYWQQLAEHLVVPLKSVDDKTEHELVQLAYELAKAVIQVECETNKQVLLNAVKNGVDVLPINEQSVHIHMHPQDIELVKESYSEEDIQERGWHLLSEPTMERGGCHIVTDSSSVNNTIEQRLKDTMDSFIASVKGN